MKLKSKICPPQTQTAVPQTQTGVPQTQTGVPQTQTAILQTGSVFFVFLKYIYPLKFNI
jgi:hypothetical protein